jgi:hypothetical protein
MVAGDDEEDPLNWAGTNDFTHAESNVRLPKALTPAQEARRARRTARPIGEPPALTAEEDLPPVTSAALLVTMGILAGVYLLYTIGWIITVQHLGVIAVTPLEEVATAVKIVLAVAGPALWFASVLGLTRERRPVVRLSWLLVGAIALVPWPFVFGISHVQ